MKEPNQKNTRNSTDKTKKPSGLLANLFGIDSGQNKKQTKQTLPKNKKDTPATQKMSKKERRKLTYPKNNSSSLQKEELVNSNNKQDAPITDQQPDQPATRQDSQVTKESDKANLFGGLLSKTDSELEPSSQQTEVEKSNQNNLASEVKKKESKKKKLPAQKTDKTPSNEVKAVLKTPNKPTSSKGFLSGLFSKSPSKTNPLDSKLEDVLKKQGKTTKKNESSDLKQKTSEQTKGKSIVLIEEVDKKDSNSVAIPENKLETTRPISVPVKSNAQDFPGVDSAKREAKQVKKIVKASEKSSEHKSFLGGLFNKSSQKENPSSTPSKPSLKEDTKGKNKSLEKGTKKNMFVDLFPQEAEKNKEDSLIETIVEQSDQPHQSILGQKLHSNPKSETLPSAVPESTALLFWARLSLLPAIIIPLVFYGFFHYQIVPSSSLLDSLGRSNLGMEYAQLVAEKTKLTTEIKNIKNKMNNLEEQSQEKLMENTVLKLRNNSINWLEVLDNIEEVTNTGIKYNEVLKRLQYKSYSFSSKDLTLSLSADLFDPTRQVFSLFTSFIEAINESEYFSGMENRNFSKSIDEKGASMSLNLNFNYIPPAQREALTTVLK